MQMDLKGENQTSPIIINDVQKIPILLDEIGFRWNHRIPTEKKTKKGRKKIVMIVIPVIDLVYSLLSGAVGRQIRRSKNGGIFRPVASMARA